MSSSATSPTPITAAPAVPQDPYRPALGVAITLLFWLWCLLAYLAVVLVAGVASGVLLACGTHPALACGPLGVDIWRALAGRLGLFIAGLTPAGQIAALALVALGVAAVWAGVVRTRALAAYRQALRRSRRTWRTSGAERLRRADAAAAAYHTATTRAWAAPRGYWGREWGQLAILLAARAELTPADQRARLLDEPLAAAATALAALDRRPHLPRLQLYAWVAAHSAQSVVLAFRAQPLAADEQRTFLAGTIAELRLARAALPARAPHAVATPVAILDNALCARLREWANLLPPAERAAPLAEAAVLYQASANALARRPWLRAGSLKMWTLALTNLYTVQVARVPLAARPDQGPILAETAAILRHALALLARPTVWLRLLPVRRQRATSRASIRTHLAYILRRQSGTATGPARRSLLAEAATLDRANLNGDARRATPRLWAATQQTYGGGLVFEALELEGAPGASRLLDAAALAYRAALDIPGWRDDPAHRSAVQRGLATVALWRSELALEGERARLLEEASAELDQALAATPREQHQNTWATTQFYLAICRHHQGEQAEGAERRRLLAEAEAIGTVVVAIRENGADRIHWATARHNLSSVRLERARLAADSEHAPLLDAAAAGLRGILEVSAVDTQFHTINQIALGMALVARLERLPPAERAPLLEEALATCRAATAPSPDDIAPRHWSEARTVLAAALLVQAESVQVGAPQAGTVEAEPAQAEATQAEATQAEATQAEATQAEATQAIGDDPAARQRLIAEAVALCHAACAACAREDAPRAWAGAHLQLAVALIAQASLMESVTARRPALDEAVAASRAALTVLTRGTYPANWGETQTCLGEALAARTAISEEGERAAMIRAAAEAWQAALEVFTAQEAPYQHERVLTVLSRLTA